MIGALRHRGPDGFGYFSDGPVGLAHARLAIIDLSTGDQPIHNETRDVWTVFNGEIFNYVELRAELEQRGHRFYTRSDTEVIVHLYEDFGDRFVEKLNGQFAIALWDAKQQRLLLARDRAGIRPLFMARCGSRLYFASEMKSLFTVAPELKQFDARGLAQIFNFWTTAGKRTAFRGIDSLPPGHVLSIDAHGHERLTQYWFWQPAASANRFSGDWRAASAQLRELLIDAVRLQLRADVPVGAYLSGGLDSSAIAALIRHYTDTPLRTFSVEFEDAEFDESAHQQEMVRALGTNHTSIVCRRTDIAAAFRDLVYHIETPVVRTAAAPLMILSGLVRRSAFKVVLTGEGADEVFAGYDLFKEASVRRFWARSPQSKWRPKLLARLYPYLRNSPVASPAFAESFFGQGLDYLDRPVFAHVPRWRTTRRVMSLLSTDAKAELGQYDPWQEYESTLPADISHWRPLEQAQYVEADTLLAGYLLSSQGDRVAMANSIEGRFPFLDHRVIEFAQSLPPRFKLRGLQEKFVLREAVRDLLPPAVLGRSKQPYRAPDSASFFAGGKLVEQAAETLAPARLAEAGLFDPVAVQHLVAKCAAGRNIGFADNMAFVAVLSTMTAYELFVRGRVTAAAAVA
jgi:asparagine synthase (glutamine-hydrolysing)